MLLGRSQPERRERKGQSIFPASVFLPIAYRSSLCQDIPPAPFETQHPPPPPFSASTTMTVPSSRLTVSFFLSAPMPRSVLPTKEHTVDTRSMMTQHIWMGLSFLS
uniref:Uncharacterized protein n=1 Tax=Pseudictyota dubia TaxID=2749911 RepID=A0A7R9WIK6_9STRA